MHPAEVGGGDVSGAQHVEGGVEIAARDVELAGEVVARAHGHDAEHAVGLGGDARQRADRAVAAARDDPASAGEGVAGEGDEVVGIGRELDLEVEPGGREGADEVGEPGVAPPSTGGGIHDRGPGVGCRAHRRGA